VVGGGAEPARDESADLVAVQARRMGLVVDPFGRRTCIAREIEQVFLDRVPVQVRDGGQPSRDGRAGVAGGFEVAGEQLDVGAADREQSESRCASPRVASWLGGRSVPGGRATGSGVAAGVGSCSR
jgi:hypothetical protein